MSGALARARGIGYPREMAGQWTLAAALLLAASSLAAAAPAPDAAPPEYSIAKIGRRFSGYTASMDDVAVSADGKRALTGDFNNNVVLWDAVRGAVLKVMPGHTTQVFSVALSPDGRAGLSGSGDGTMRYWDLDGGKLIRETDVKGTQVLCVAFSADGLRAVSGDEAGGVKVWRLSDGALLKDLGPHEAPILSAAFVNGDRALLTTDFDNRAALIDLASGKTAAAFHYAGHKPAVKGFVSPDRKTFVVVGDRVELRDAASGALVSSFPQGAVTGELGTRAAFSPDGKLVLVEGDRQRLSLREAASGRVLRVFLPPKHARAYAFSADGKSLLGVFGGVDTILSWPVDPPDGSAESPSAAPADDPRRTDVAALGRLLLFDPRLSADGRVSCATCHDPKKGWADGRKLAVGIGGAIGARNTQTLINVSLHHPLFWDGRANDLEEQVHFPFANMQEMAFSLEGAARKLSLIAGYRPFFTKAFGDEKVTPERISAAIAAFERTLISLDSPYDRFAAGDAKALSDPAKRGLALFRSKGRCFVCHELNPAEHEQFVDIGLPQSKDAPDDGRFTVSKAEVDRRSFRVPDLHALKYTAPYMHDGSLDTLAKVVDFYDRGGDPDPNKSAWVLPLKLTPDEKADLVSFLESLSGDPLIQAPPASLPR